MPAAQVPAAQVPAAQVPAAQVPAARVPAARVPAARVQPVEAAVAVALPQEATRAQARVAERGRVDRLGDSGELPRALVA